LSNPHKSLGSIFFSNDCKARDASITAKRARHPMNGTSLLDFIPLLSLLGATVWITYVHRSNLRELRSAYASAGVPFPSTFTLSAWSPFRVTPNDPAVLKDEKERILATIKRQNRFFIPIVFASFFGLAILSMILRSVLQQ
jgi:hypothetical protein